MKQPNSEKWYHFIILFEQLTHFSSDLCDLEQARGDEEKREGEDERNGWSSSSYWKRRRDERPSIDKQRGGVEGERGVVW